MQTLHEFMLVTKGQEYLIAIGFLFMFILFWQLLFRAPAVRETIRAFSFHDLRIPAAALFHTGHTWSLLTPEGNLRIGVDDFLRGLIDPVDEIGTPQKGTKVDQGESFFTLKRGSRELQVPAPLSGSVITVNTRGVHRTHVPSKRLPEQEWLIELAPNRFDTEKTRLVKSTDAAGWFQKEMQRLVDFLNTQSARPNIASAALADGGEPVRGAVGHLDDQGWREFQRIFLGPGERSTGKSPKRPPIED